jgi:hypothetical protein
MPGVLPDNFQTRSDFKTSRMAPPFSVSPTQILQLLFTELISRYIPIFTQHSIISNKPCIYDLSASKARLKPLVLSPLHQNIKMGEAVIDKVNSKLIASNRNVNKDNVTLVDATNNSESELDEYVRFLVSEKQTESVSRQDILDSILWMKDLMDTKNGIGNCMLMAELAASILINSGYKDVDLVAFDGKQGFVNIKPFGHDEKSEKINPEHVFILYGKGKDISLSDYNNWIPSAVIIDPWSKQCLPARRFEEFSKSISKVSGNSISIKIHEPVVLKNFKKAQQDGFILFEYFSINYLFSLTIENKNKQSTCIIM